MTTIIYKSGDVFESHCSLLCNPINCVGVMGKGMALQFKNKYPNMFGEYAEKCRAGDVRVGYPYIYEEDSMSVLMFPTKKHWQDPSNIKWIDEGLKAVAYVVVDPEIFPSIAFPALGSGLGGLDFRAVAPLFLKYFLGSSFELIEIYNPKN